MKLPRLLWTTKAVFLFEQETDLLSITNFFAVFIGYLVYTLDFYHRQLFKIDKKIVFDNTL